MEPPQMTAFGRLLRTYRTRRAFSQEELADRAGLSVRGISDLERGVRRNPQRETVQMLAETLGLSDGEQQQFEASVERTRKPATSLKTSLASPSPPHNLPIQLTSFIGRDQEIEQVRGILQRPSVRLLTLTGAGGTGKTRLALRVAEDALDSFLDGVWFIDLSPIKDPSLVVSAIAQTLGVREAGGQSLIESLKAFLHERSLLLVLDNFEQVLEAAPLISELLSAALELKILVTSRTALRLSLEHLCQVPPLGLPELGTSSGAVRLAEAESVRLFAERARAVRRDFRVTDANTPAVAEICRQLDGLPLAIELAAARVRLFEPWVLLPRLADRLKLLSGGPRDAPARQRTLRAAIDWSYELLGEDERILFHRLSVFAGGFELNAAEAVCGLEGQPDVLDPVGALLDGSLLRRFGGEVGDPRFGMLETVREYATERLEASGEAEEIRHRHAQHFLELAEEGEQHLGGPQQMEYRNRLVAEQDNFRATLRWSLGGGDAELGLRVIGLLDPLWTRSGRVSEGRLWLDQILAQDIPASPSVRAKVLAAGAALASMQGDAAQAKVWAEESLALLRESGDTEGVANALIQLGWALYRSDYGRAGQLFEESLGLFGQLRDGIGISRSLIGLGCVALTYGEYARGAVLLEQALAVSKETGNTQGMAHAIYNLAWAALAQGDLVRADTLYREALARFRTLGDTNGMAIGLEGLAALAAAADQPMRSACLLGAAAARREVFGIRLPQSDRIRYEAHYTAARDRIDEVSWETARATGEAMGLDEAISYALNTDQGQGSEA